MVLIPTPVMIAEFVNNIPAGDLVSQADLRANLANKYGADMTCPITTAKVIKELGHSIPLDRLILSKSLATALLGKETNS